MVCYAREILIPEDRSNVTKLLCLKQACMLNSIDNVSHWLAPQYSGDISFIAEMTLHAIGIALNHVCDIIMTFLPT